MKLNLDYLKEIAGGDQDFINEILETYLSEVPKDVHLLQEAISSKDFLQTQKTAHKMKSSFRLLGLNDLYQTSLFLENTAKQQIPDWNVYHNSLTKIQTQVEESITIIKKEIQ